MTEQLNWIELSRKKSKKTCHDINITFPIQKLRMGSILRMCPGKCKPCQIGNQDPGILPAGSDLRSAGARKLCTERTEPEEVSSWKENLAGRWQVDAQIMSDSPSWDMKKACTGHLHITAKTHQLNSHLQNLGCLVMRLLCGIMVNVRLQKKRCRAQVDYQPCWLWKQQKGLPSQEISKEDESNNQWQEPISSTLCRLDSAQESSSSSEVRCEKSVNNTMTWISEHRSSGSYLHGKLWL